MKWIAPIIALCLHPQDAQEATVTSSPAAKTKPTPLLSNNAESQASNKRARAASHPDTAKPRKRQKTVTPSTSESDESDLSSPPEDLKDNSAEEQPSTRAKKPRGKLSKTKKTSPPSKTDEKETIVEEVSNDDGNGVTATELSKAEGKSHSVESESEMSEVLDEAPPPKKKGQKATAASKKEQKPVKAKGKEDVNIDPQGAEINRLQSWLLKCGIRKMWYKELAPYTSSKAKISHLKDMLKDAGMDGRYSVEKARQIKDVRELKAELEAVQEGAKQWGEPAATGSDDAGRRPTRRLAKGLREFDFLGDDDGEETD